MLKMQVNEVIGVYLPYIKRIPLTRQINIWPQYPTLNWILNTVCELTGQPRWKVISHSRKRELVAVRRLYCWTAYRYTRHSYEVIANVINRDHSDLIHYLKTLQDLLFFPSSANDYIRIMDMMTKILSDHEITRKGYQ